MKAIALLGVGLTVGALLARAMAKRPEAEPTYVVVSRPSSRGRAVSELYSSTLPVVDPYLVH